MTNFEHIKPLHMRHFLTLLSVSSIFMAFAQLPGWNHSKTIQLQENSGVNLINYQLELTINTANFVSNGEMLATGDDIRFTSSCTGGTVYSYWIESGMNSASTKIWVKIDTLLANSTKNIYMHYGNNAASPVSAVVGTFNGPHSSTDSVASGGPGGAANSQRGFRFSPNETLLVTAFGKREPNGSTRFVTLFDFATQAILAQTQVSGPAAQYSYSNLSNPIWLQQGTQYLIQLYQGASDGYYFGTSSQIGQHLTYFDMRYCNSCTENTFPTSTLSNYHYGYPDLWYFTKNTASVAPSYTLVNMSLDLADNATICAGDSVTLNPVLTNGTGPFEYAWTNTSISDSTAANPVFFPVNSMYYYLSLNDACGNMVEDSVYLNVNPAPVFNINATSTTICFGTSATLVADGTYDFIWSNGVNNDTIIVTPTADTNFSVIATDLQGCTSSDSISLQVLPTIEVTNAVSICFGTTYTINGNVYSATGNYQDTLIAANGCDSVVTTQLTVKPEVDAQISQNELTLSVPAGADNYQWIDCTNLSPLANETNATFTATANGTYACIVTFDGCDNQSDCIVINNVGIVENLNANGFTVYPNPVTTTLQITSSISQAIDFTDATGRIIFTIAMEANQAKAIDVSAYPSGLYWLKGLKQTEKINIQR